VGNVAGVFQVSEAHVFSIALGYDYASKLSRNGERYTMSQVTQKGGRSFPAVSNLATVLLGLILVGNPKDCVGKPMAERLIVLELFKKLSIIREECCDYPFQGLIVLNAGVLAIRVLAGILICLVC
jgi:hypothetical protein